MTVPSNDIVSVDVMLDNSAMETHTYLHVSIYILTFSYILGKKDML